MALNTSKAKQDHYAMKIGFGEPLEREILVLAARSNWQVGTQLKESVLAEAFNLSRTPINKALKELTARGIADHVPNRGYFLKAHPEASLKLTARHGEIDQTYIMLARDALQWGSGSTLTIADLETRYEMPRSRVQRLLERAQLEGWITRGAGYKWTVTLGIESEADYAGFYRFREAIEPAAVMEPDYAVDHRELKALVTVQTRLAEGDFETINAIDLFEINTELHETIVSWSGNVLFIDALRRGNASRRLLEYTKVLKTNKIDTFAAEHIKILQHLNAGRHLQASDLLRKHLQVARKAKVSATA